MFYRFAQKLEYADLFFSAFDEGIPADIPAVKIQSPETVAQQAYPYRVQPAGYGLPEIRLPAEPAFLDGAEAVAVPVEMGIGALLAARHQRGHHVPVPVYFEKARGGNPVPSLLPHLRGEYGVVLLYGLRLAFLKRGAAVPDDAAAAFALPVVAGEVFCQYLAGYQAVVNLDYRMVVFHIVFS